MTDNGLSHLLHADDPIFIISEEVLLTHDPTAHIPTPKPISDHLRRNALQYTQSPTSSEDDENNHPLTDPRQRRVHPTVAARRGRACHPHRRSKRRHPSRVQQHPVRHVHDVNITNSTTTTAGDMDVGKAARKSSAVPVAGGGDGTKTWTMTMTTATTKEHVTVLGQSYSPTAVRNSHHHHHHHHHTHQIVQQQQTHSLSHPTVTAPRSLPPHPHQQQHTPLPPSSHHHHQMTYFHAFQTSPSSSPSSSVSSPPHAPPPSSSSTKPVILKPLNSSPSYTPPSSPPPQPPVKLLQQQRTSQYQPLLPSSRLARSGSSEVTLPGSLVTVDDLADISQLSLSRPSSSKSMSLSASTSFDRHQVTRHGYTRPHQHPPQMALSPRLGMTQRRFGSSISSSGGDGGSGGRTTSVMGGMLRQSQTEPAVLNSRSGDIISNNNCSSSSSNIRNNSICSNSISCSSNSSSNSFIRDHNNNRDDHNMMMMIPPLGEANKHPISLSSSSRSGGNATKSTNEEGIRRSTTSTNWATATTRATTVQGGRPPTSVLPRCNALCRDQFMQACQSFAANYLNRRAVSADIGALGRATTLGRSDMDEEEDSVEEQESGDSNSSSNSDSNSNSSDDEENSPNEESEDWNEDEEEKEDDDDDDDDDDDVVEEEEVVELWRADWSENKEKKRIGRTNTGRTMMMMKEYYYDKTR